MDDQLPNNDTATFKFEPKGAIELELYRMGNEHPGNCCTICGDSYDPRCADNWGVFGVNGDFDVKGYGDDVVVCARCLGSDIDERIEERAQMLEREAELKAGLLRDLKGRIRVPLPVYKEVMPF